MSQNSKKVGLKKLSKKRNSKQTEETKTSYEELTQHFESFISLSNSNRDGNKDDSVIIVGSVSKNVLSPDSQTDYFQFPKKKSVAAATKQSCLETTALSPVPTCSTKSDDTEQLVVTEITKNQSISTETSSKYVRVSNLFEDSSLLFQNNTNSFNTNKSIDKNTDSVVVKALSENLNSSNNGKNETDNSSEVNSTLPNLKVKGCASERLVKSEESTEPETVQQCPICLKTVSKYVTHMKSCAAKNKLNTQQLLSALKLHKKQLAERKELGLDVPVQGYRAKVSPKRSRAKDKKGPRDANLQLALALSASLRAAEEDEVIQEAEALKAAGLTLEADQKLGTLEQFGFASAIAPQPRSLQGSSKSRPLLRSLLLERSKEERERILTEKIAIVLISEEENVSLDNFCKKEPNVKSKLLKKAWDKDCQLWAKAHCQAEEERSKFYVVTLMEFVSPCKTEVGAALRRLSQLPGRLNTPHKDNFFDLSSTPKSSITGEMSLYELPTPSRSRSDKHSIDTAPTVHKSSSRFEIKKKLSDDWNSLVDNTELSDLEILCKDGSVPAHRLVFHVRCPKILQDLCKDNGTVIVLKNSSKAAVLAMLEFVYSGSLNRIFRLDEEDFTSLSDLVDKLDITELKTHLRLGGSQESSCKNKSKSENCKELFEAGNESQNDLYGVEHLSPCKNIFLHASRRKSFESNSETLPEPELCPSNELESTDSSCGRGSPDMFGESNVMENKSFPGQTQNDLDILASLVGKTTAISEDEFDKLSKNNCSKDKNSTAIVSPSDSLVNELSSGKRKALESSDSEELSFSKRPCSEWSKRVASNSSDEGEVFDLTQSSNSNENDRQDNCRDKDAQFEQNDVLCVRDSSNCEVIDDSMEGLTQKDPSVLDSHQNISSASKKTPESQNKSVYEDYFEPAWDGYEDYLYFNYTPISTPVKPTSTEEKSSKHSSINKSFQFPCRKTNAHDLSLLTPKIPSDVNYISSDSNSPKQSSQSMLDKRSSKSNIFHTERSESPKFRCSKSSQEIATSTITKRRKNWSPQFNNSDNSPVHFSPVHTPNTTISQTSKSPESSPRTSYDGSKKSPLKRDSLAAMQRLLDDSFNVSDSVFANADALIAEEAKHSQEQTSPLPCTSSQLNKSNSDIGERNKNSMMTPTPEIIASDNVTPLPDYSAMKTPSLKRELSKYGLKPSLRKRKAKLMLRYIYDQTHPFVPDPGGSTDVQPETSKQPSGHPPRSPMKSPQKIQSEVNLVDSESDAGEYSSQKSFSSVSSSATTLPEESFCKFDDVLTQDVCSVGDLKAAIRSLIVNNPDLYRRVLMYEPIFLDEFMGMLKANGIKCKINDVMNYLDEQCITFRTNSWKATNEKRRQKNLKKKAKDTSCQGKKSMRAKPIGSPSKQQLNPVKKRGRPRKNINEQSKDK